MIYLGIDCGTQSLKVLAWRAETSHCTSVSCAYDLIPGLPPGHKEQHPRDWINALGSCMLQLKDQGVPMDLVRGIGVSGQQHGLVVLDKHDQVIRPAKLWNDTSTLSQCEKIMEQAGGAEPYKEEIGNSLPPGFTASKVLWIKENEPPMYERISSMMLPHDYLDFYLTGQKSAEAGDASGTGYFRVSERIWSEKALGWIDPGRDLLSCLPPLIASGGICGGLRKTLSESWGIPLGTPVSSGGGDNMMGAIGTGNVVPGVMTVSLGTSGTLYSFSQEPVIDPLGEVAAFCDSTGAWLPLVCTMNVTVATEMVRKNILGYEHAEFSREVESVSPGSDGLVMLPFLEGERVPSVPDGCGVLLGLRPAACSPAHLARAAMEGASMGLKYGFQRLKSLGIETSELRLTGGGAKSPAWRQILADLFGVPVICPEKEEGPAYGAALQACWAVEKTELAALVSEWVSLDETTRHHPIEKNQAVYENLYSLYSTLSDSMVHGRIFPEHRKFIE